MAEDKKRLGEAEKFQGEKVRKFQGEKRTEKKNETLKDMTLFGT